MKGDGLRQKPDTNANPKRLISKSEPQKKTWLRTRISCFIVYCHRICIYIYKYLYILS